VGIGGSGYHWLKRLRDGVKLKEHYAPLFEEKGHRVTILAKGEF